MIALLGMELGKLAHLTSVRFGLVVLAVFPWLWAYAPGVFDVYDFFIVSGFQVPALSLLSSMAYLLPLLVAIAAAELLGIEIQHGTLPTVLLRPVTRSQWLLAKLIVTGFVGSVLRTTVNVALVPSSTVFPEIAETVIPGTSSFVFVAETSSTSIRS